MVNLQRKYKVYVLQLSQIVILYENPGFEHKNIDF